MEKYSVLMSVYYKESPDYFAQALDSIIHQTIMPNEIVLVEDGPLSEELYRVIELYCSNYPDLIHCVINKHNLGLGLALNAGLQACENELVARMDTDDIANPDRCEKQLKYFNDHPDIDIIGGQIVEFDNETHAEIGKRIVPETDQELKKYLKTRCPFNHMTVMYKKSSVLAAGNYLDWFWNEDYYLWIRMAMNNCLFANLPDILVNVRSGYDLYSRRGGLKYFKSEVSLQNYLLKNSLINVPTYCLNVLKRLVVQILLPNSMRSFVFRTIARKQ